MPHKAFLSTTVGRHRLKRPKSANLLCSAHLPVSPLKGEVPAQQAEGVAAVNYETCIPGIRFTHLSAARVVTKQLLTARGNRGIIYIR